MASDSHVHFDKNGVSYVEYEHLRSSPEVQRQLDAARRFMQRTQTAATGKSFTADQAARRHEAGRHAAERRAAK